MVTYINSKNGNTTIFNRMLEGFDDNSVITLGRAVYEKGKYLGTILVETPISYLDEWLNPFEDNSIQLYVLEDNQRIIYSSVFTENSQISEELKMALEEKGILLIWKKQIICFHRWGWIKKICRWFLWLRQILSFMNRHR